MENEIWIARDLPMLDEAVGDIVIYSRKPIRDVEAGIFMPQPKTDESLMFFECGDLVSHIILNPEAFPEITWENSPQRLTINQL